MNLSWIHDDALALHESVSPATPYKRLQALGNLRSGVFFLASLLLWLEREKNNAWFIYLTSR